MNPNIPKNFWSRPYVESLPHQGRLALIWAMTTPLTTLAGVLDVSPARFSFDTGLPPDWLARTVRAIPDVLVRSAEGIWVATHIEDQFGRAERLIRNSCLDAVFSSMRAIRDPALLAAIVLRYPELVGLKTKTKTSPLDSQIVTKYPPATPLPGGWLPPEGGSEEKGNVDVFTETDEGGRDGSLFDGGLFPAEDAAPAVNGNGGNGHFPNGHAAKTPRAKAKEEPIPPELLARLGALKGRRATTRWQDNEFAALRKIMPLDEDDLAVVERYYALPVGTDGYAPCVAILTVLIAWNKEVEKARTYFARRAAPRLAAPAQARRAPVGAL